MITSRIKQRAGPRPAGEKDSGPKLPSVDEFLAKRDFAGARAVLEFERAGLGPDEAEKRADNLMWLGYCDFHAGAYDKALDSYTEALASAFAPGAARLHAAVCMFYLGQYKEAMDAAKRCEESQLYNRILFHASHRMGDEDALMQYHQKLADTKLDQLSLAAIHYLRNHFQEATDVYKRLLLENRDDIALNVYVAMCYYKLDYYDVSLEILAVYLQAHPDSAVAINLKACNHFRLYNGKAAEGELRVLEKQGNALQDNDLVRHNLVVFSGGANALQVLPPLVGFVPEARLNLVIYHLKQNDVKAAFELVKDLEPATPPEYILKGVVNATLGQMSGSREHVKMAQQYFQLVGASASECDTIPGRQCMAQCFFLLRQFDDVNIYLDSIKAYMYNDDNFNWDYGLSLCAVGKYKAAEEALLLVQDEKYRMEYTYIAALARCYIHNGNARAAWEQYLKMETSSDSLNLVQLIANECYKMGAFLFAAKAFDVLERMDPEPEYWEGKRGACIGVLQMVIAGKEQKTALTEVVRMLRSTSNPQVEYIVRTISKWAQDNGVLLPGN